MKRPIQAKLNFGKREETEEKRRRGGGGDERGGGGEAGTVPNNPCVVEALKSYS